MKTAADYLDAIKASHGIGSDYELAKRLGWSRPRISHYRSGLHHFDESGALQVAALLDLDPAAVLLDTRAGLLHHPYWRRPFDVGDLRAMFYRTQLVTILERDLARLRADLEKAHATADAAEHRAAFYRRQLVLESTTGAMLARIQA